MCQFRRLLPPRWWLAILLVGGPRLPGAGAAAAGSWPAQYSPREWHVQDGLPSEDVTRVHQDRSGYLWMATGRGVARFDGFFFEEFEGEFKALGIPPTITAISETADLGVVFASTAGGLVAFREGRFRRLEEVRDRAVNSLYAGADGTLWGSCDDNTLFRLQAGKLEIHTPEVRGPHRLVGRFAPDAAGRLWIAGGSFIGRYEGGRVVVLNDEFGGGIDFRVAASREGGVWVMTAEQLGRVDGSGLHVVLPRLPPLAGAHYASALLEDHQGTLWLGTRSQGLYAVVEGECRVVPTSGEGIASLCEDNEGDVWVASNGGGLNRLRYRDFQLYDRTKGLGDNFSYTVSEDQNGDVWFGNRDGGVARLHQGKIEVFSSWPGWPQFSVTSVLPDGAGRLWVTNGAGVFKIDPAAGDSLTRVDAFPSRPTVRVHFMARNGDYWAGLDPDRVGRYRDGILKSYGLAEGFEGRQVRAIAEDASGGILLGTDDGKLIRFDGRQFTRLPLEVKDGKETSIQDIHVEPATGIIWLGTAGNGLYVLRDGRCHAITVAQGLLDSTITAIIPDDQGSLWFGSTMGVFSLRRQELVEVMNGTVARVHPVIVGRDDGLHGLTCLGLYKPSAWKGRDGRLWFATRKGVLNFDPARAISDVPPPPVLVAGVQCDDERRLLTGPLEISAGVRKLELRLSVLCLSTPDRVQIRYRLDGFDSQWINAGPDRIVTYPRLPPGRYRLRAMASLGNGVWNEREPVLAITVTPRWWQTLWFQLLAAGATLAGVAFIARARSHRRLRLRLARLEQESAVERERTRIARNIHDELGASLTRISLLTQTAKRNEVAAPSPQLGQIYETVRQITRSMDEIVWAVDPGKDNLDSLATYLVSYAQSFLAVAGIRCRLDLPASLPAAGLTSQARHNLYLCLKEALNNVVKHAGADEVTIALGAADSRLTMTVTDNGRPHGPNGAGGNGHGAHHEGRISSGHGLANIARRVAEMGGTCEFLPPGDGRGARLTITLALAAAARAHPAPARPAT